MLTAATAAHRSRARERGFTMVELLVVAIVMSIITAIGIPMFLRHRDNAKLESVRSDAEQAGLALKTQALGSGMIPASLDAQGTGLWSFKPTAPNTVAEYMASGDRFRVCLVNTTTSPRPWAYYESATEKVTSGTGTEPTGACDGNTTGPALAAEPTRGPSTPFPTPPVVTEPPPPPDMPTGVSASAVLGENQARVVWSGVSGATSYKVFVDGSTTPAWSGTALAATITGLSNGSHTFRVRAVEDGRESSLSTQASATVDSNDDAVAAHAVSASISPGAVWYSADHSNATATAQASETTPSTRSMWWRFSPAADGTYTFDAAPPAAITTTPSSPQVTVWRVSASQTTPPTPNPTQMARGAYNPTGSSTAADGAPIVAVSTGYDYLVRVSASDVGRFRLKVTRGPGNDMLSNTTPITQPAVGSTNTGTGDLTFSAEQASEPAGGRASVWYTMTRTQSTAADIEISVSGAAFTPTITVWKTSTTIAGNLGSPIASQTGSSVTIPASSIAQGETLRIRVSTTSAARGSFSLRVTSSAVQNCFHTRFYQSNGTNYVEWDPFPGADAYYVVIREDGSIVGSYFIYPGQSLSVTSANYESIQVTVRTNSGDVVDGGCQ